MVLTASSVVVVVRAVLSMVVDALSPSSGHDGVLCVAIGPELALDH
jgi:hypothetical protein